jgi:hypothetical protein
MAKRKKGANYKRRMSKKTGVSEAQLSREQRNAEGLQNLASARAKYRAAGDPDSCGDDVAKALKAAFGAGESFDTKGLIDALKINDCKVPNVDMEKPGAVGRLPHVRGHRSESSPEAKRSLGHCG